MVVAPRVGAAGAGAQQGAEDARHGLDQDGPDGGQADGDDADGELEEGEGGCVDVVPGRVD